MRILMHHFPRLILVLTIGCCILGNTSPVNGQQTSGGNGSLHAAQLHPARFVFGAELFARPINTVVPPAYNGAPASVLLPAQIFSTGSLPNGAGVTPSNVFGPFYANPLAGGGPNSFGAPQYGPSQSANTLPTPQASNRGSTQVPTVQSGLQLLTTAPDSATVVIGPADDGAAVRPSARVPVPMLFAPPAGAVPQRDDLQQIISRSSALSSRDAIRVLRSGSEVILRGSVVSDYDRRLAEALLMLSPQVQTVRNELTVVQ